MLQKLINSYSFIWIKLKHFNDQVYKDRLTFFEVVFCGFFHYFKLIH